MKVAQGRGRENDRSVASRERYRGRDCQRMRLAVRLISEDEVERRIMNHQLNYGCLCLGSTSLREALFRCDPITPAIGDIYDT